MTEALLTLEDLADVPVDCLVLTRRVIDEALADRSAEIRRQLEVIAGEAEPVADAPEPEAPARPKRARRAPPPSRDEILAYAEEHSDSETAKQFGLENHWVVKALRNAEPE